MVRRLTDRESFSGILLGLQFQQDVPDLVNQVAVLGGGGGRGTVWRLPTP